MNTSKLIRSRSKYPVIMTLTQIGVRVDTSVKDQIKRLVDEGKYRDITDFAAKAIHEKLERENFQESDKIKQAIFEIIRSNSEMTIEINDSNFSITGKRTSKAKPPADESS